MKQATNVLAWLLAVWILMMPGLLSANSAESFVPPPKLPNNIDNLPPTLSFAPATKVILGTLVVDLEHTTLGEILRSAGIGVIQHRGDAGDSEDWVCFTMSSATQSQRIWISSGELGGSEHTVSSFYAAASDGVLRESRHCPELPAQLRPVSLGSSVWLGSTENQLGKWLGKASAKKDGWWLYSYSGKVTVIGHDEPFDVGALLGVRFVNGKVVALFASKSTTN